MLVVEAFAAKDYLITTGLTKIDVNIPALFPLKPNNAFSNTESISNIYLNKLEIANTVVSTNFLSIKISAGLQLPDKIYKGHKFLLFSPDGDPLNGLLMIY